MKKIIALLLLLTATASVADQRLPDWTARTGSGDEVRLHDRLADSSGTLLAIVASDSQENGQEQQRALLNTHQQLAEAMDDLPPVMHLTLIAGAPRLVHGFIRRGLAREYEAPVRDEDILMVFLSDYDNYTEPSGLTVDEQGTWVWIDGQGVIYWVLRESDDDTAERLMRALEER
ncbi:MAG: hypothetical protein LAT62_13710 [Natronospirillum sp.]|uniref:hypothetical protein n=1 Tax=Natronospirillum sp. TaxID=2812955 RepID=UPI0025DF5616|nr:hypothetical protein [Natronospirillum sp.]MCH8552988.1 hypothetical protein [Natronospirillum sp.]